MIKLAFRAFSALGIARKKPRTCVDTQSQILSQLITQGDNVSVVVQHHVPSEPSPACPTLAGEVQSLVLKGQQPLETRRLIITAAPTTALWATVLLFSYSRGSSS